METLRKIIGDTLEELDGMDIDNVTEGLINALISETGMELEGEDGKEVRYMTRWMQRDERDV